MDFFARQESARRRTWWLVVLFAAALGGIIATAYLAVVAAMGVTSTGTNGIPSALSAPAALRWDPALFAALSSAISLVVFGGTAYKLSQLSKGGTVVADMLGARRINPATTQFHERRALNVVEEMALASGVPVPPVYVIPGQMGINAFAAGYSINDAVVGLTEGALRGLKREELQGVVGHEFSHILNGDMRMNIRLIGILHGLLVLALVGRLLIRLAGNSRGNRKGGAGLLLVAIGLGLLVIGYAGYFFGGLIRRAVSRQREYLADASAVQFTRNPSGLAEALKKIGGLARGAQVEASHAEEVSHLFFADGMKRLFGAGSLFSTHPPLVKRIQALEPDFTGEFPALTPDNLVFSGMDPEKPAPAKASGKGREFIQRTVMMGGGMAGASNPLLEQAGMLDAYALAGAEQVLASLPGELRAMTREPIGAQALILALVLGSSDQESSPFAWTWLPAFLSNAVDRAVELLKKSGPEHRLPLVDMCLPALREMSRDQALRFMETLEEIIKADNRIDLFEFSIREIIRAGLRDAMGKPVRPISITSVHAEVVESATVLLSLLAHSGTRENARAEAAFAAGMARLGDPAAGASLRPVDLLSMDDAATALQRFLVTSMPVRKAFLDAAETCLRHDQEITLKEAELFRTLATVLEVPMPPTLAAKA